MSKLSDIFKGPYSRASHWAAEPDLKGPWTPEAIAKRQEKMREPLGRMIKPGIPDGLSPEMLKALKGTIPAIDPEEDIDRPGENASKI